METEVLALFEVLAAEAPAALAELDTAVLAAVALHYPPDMLNKPPFLASIFFYKSRHDNTYKVWCKKKCPARLL